ncbi:MAG: hypothetical protein JWN52_4967 [Actinomycetia bacterium]|nr:hypothetical protein [Actinomycetes bacterium]
MRSTRSKVAALAVTTTLTLASLPAAAHAAPFKPEPSAAGGITAEAKRIDAVYVPLRKVANAVDGAGRASSADVYSGLYLNGSKGTVDVWLTDTAKAGRVLAEAKKLDPRANFNRVHIHKGAFSRATLNIVRDELISSGEHHKLPYHLFSGSVAYDGSGIQAGVSSVAEAKAHEPARKRTLQARALAVRAQNPASVPVTFFKGEKAATTAYDKWDDQNNQIGGDQLKVPGGWCTAGFAADDSSGRDYLVTAGHCANNGDTIKSGHGSATVGTVVSGPFDRYDSELIRGNTSGNYYNDEGEYNNSVGSFYKVLSGGHAYSHSGDVVCQNGVSTAWRQAETPCNITVVNENAWWDVDLSSYVQGVIGTRPYSTAHPAVIQGDSGATVFTYNGGNRQLRGIVEAANPCAFIDGSKGGSCTSYGNKTLFSVTMPDGGTLKASNSVGWVEATDILNHFGLTQDTKP